MGSARPSNCGGCPGGARRVEVSPPAAAGSWRELAPGDLADLQRVITTPDDREKLHQLNQAMRVEFGQASILVARTGLPPETTDPLYSVQREIEQRRDVLFAQRPATHGAGRGCTWKGKEMY